MSTLGRGVIILQIYRWMTVDKLHATIVYSKLLLVKLILILIDNPPVCQRRSDTGLPWWGKSRMEREVLWCGGHQTTLKDKRGVGLGNGAVKAIPDRDGSTDYPYVVGWVLISPTLSVKDVPVFRPRTRVGSWDVHWLGWYIYVFVHDLIKQGQSLIASPVC